MNPAFPYFVILTMVLSLTSDRVLANQPIPEAVLSQLQQNEPQSAHQLEFLKDIEKTTLKRSLSRVEDFKIKRALLEASGLSPAEINAVLLSSDAMGGSPAFPSRTTPTFPTRGTPQLPVILVDFKDQFASTLHSDITPELVTRDVFGDGLSDNHPYESLHNYYQRASNGQLSVKGEVLGWVELDRKREKYAPRYKTLDTAKQKIEKRQQALYDIFTEAMTKLDEHTDFSVFDNNNDGEIDAVVLLYAGPTDEWNDFFWAYQWEFWINSATGASAKRFDGKAIRQFVFQNVADTQTGKFSNRTLLHEFGHLLGIRDYYDYCPSSHFNSLSTCAIAGLKHPGPDGGIGGFDMMHAMHANHNAYSRWLLDWTKRPVVVGSGTQTIDLAASGKKVDVNSTVQSIAIFPNLDQQIDQTAPAREMFIAELRSSAGNDALSVPAEQAGLAVWHVAADIKDSPVKTRYDNSYTAIKHLRLMRSNNASDYSEDESNRFTPEELFQAGEIFGPATIPQSLGHDGRQTGVTISDIVINGDTAKATFSIASSDAQSAMADSPTKPPSTDGLSTAQISQENQDRYRDVDLDHLLETEERLGNLSASDLTSPLIDIQSNLADNLQMQSILETQIISAKLAERDPQSAIRLALGISLTEPSVFETLPAIAANAAAQKDPGALVKLLENQALPTSTHIIAAQALTPIDDRFQQYVQLASQIEQMQTLIARAETGTAATGGRVLMLKTRNQRMNTQLIDILRQINTDPKPWDGSSRW